MISLHEQYVTDERGSTTGVLIAKDEYDRLVDYVEELEDITAYREEKVKGDQMNSKWKDIRKS